MKRTTKSVPITVIYSSTIEILRFLHYASLHIGNKPHQIPVNVLSALSRGYTRQLTESQIRSLEAIGRKFGKVDLRNVVQAILKGQFKLSI
jgi:hypothetical protein